MTARNHDRRSELDAFKELNLSVVASSFGYRMVKAKSTRHSVLMESSNDKIIVSKNGKHYVYCSVFNDLSNGTIIDFAQRAIEPGATLGRVRQLLRPFLDVLYFSNIQRKHGGQFANSIIPSNTDFLAVAARYSQFEPISGHHSYLCDERKIPLELLSSNRLKGKIRHCPKRATVIFPHWGSLIQSRHQERMVTGYEIKGTDVNLFSKSGSKGLWMSRGFCHDRVLVFTESGLDALSYLALHPSTDIRIASVSGQLNKRQPQLMCSAISHMSEDVQVVAAFDNDKSGDFLTQLLYEKLILNFGNGILFKEDRPRQRGTDWNDTLMNRATPNQHPIP